MAKKNRTTGIYSRGTAPTRERQQKLGGILSEPVHEKSGSKTYITRYRSGIECSLDHYRDAQKISLAEHEAGMKFRRAYLRAVLHIQTQDTTGSHGDREMAYVTPIYSEHLLRKAHAVLSSVQKSVLIDVCGHDFGVGNTSRLMTLRRGLDELVELWKIS